MDADRIRALMPELSRQGAELEATAPGRSFTSDGHLLGSIGELLAQLRLQRLTAEITQPLEGIALLGALIDFLVPVEEEEGG